MTSPRTPKWFTWRDLAWAELELLVGKFTRTGPVGGPWGPAWAGDGDGSDPDHVEGADRVEWGHERVAADKESDEAEILKLLGFEEGDHLLPSPKMEEGGEREKNLRRECPNGIWKLLVSKCGLDWRRIFIPCRRRSCDVCRKAWLAEMRETYRSLIEQIGRVSKLRFATFTITSMGLNAGLKKIKLAMARLQRTKFWRACVVAGLKRYEWTIRYRHWRDRNGLFHVHAHVVLAGKYMDQQVLKELWIRSTEGVGEITDIRFVYDDQHITDELIKWKRANPAGGQGQPMSYQQTAEYLCEDVELPVGNDVLREEIFEILEHERLIEPLGLFREVEYKKEIGQTAEKRSIRAAALQREVEQVAEQERRLRATARLIQEQMESVEDRDDGRFALQDKLIDVGFKIKMARELRGSLTWARHRRQVDVVDVILPVIGEWFKVQAAAAEADQPPPCRNDGCTGWRPKTTRGELRPVADEMYYQTTVYARGVAAARGQPYDEEAEAEANQKAHPGGFQDRAAGPQGSPEAESKEGPARPGSEAAWSQGRFPWANAGA